jgi:hypothetical protein
VSADNFGRVAKHPLTGRWYLLHGFASDDEFTPRLAGDGHREREDALDEASADSFEYGWAEADWPEVWFEYCDHCGDYGERYVIHGGVFDAAGRKLGEARP